MIQILVVDDEVHCAEGVKAAVDWSVLGVGNVFTAYSMGQAQKVMEKEKIDIVFSDVEMPKGSGFELLRWFRDCSYHPVVIMLTSYATFDYAKQALEFGCMDYLLKPVSSDTLIKTAKAAIDLVMKQKKTEESTRLAEYWNENERNRVRHFWRDILENHAELDSGSITERANEQHIVLDVRNHYMPVLFKLHVKTGKIRWSEALKYRIYDEVFEKDPQAVLMYNDRYMLAIVGCAADIRQHREGIRDHIRSFIQTFSDGEEGIRGISAYMGEFSDAEKVPDQYEELLKMAIDNVAGVMEIYNIHQQSGGIEYHRPEMEGWMLGLGKEDAGEIINIVQNYVDDLVERRMVDHETLTRLLHDFMQVFYIVVNEKGIWANLLFEDETSGALFEKAAYSVSAFKSWAAHVIGKASDYIRLVADSETVVSHIKAYITQHLTDDLGRDMLAREFYMSPDYISRIFKQQTGQKLVDYITDARMNEAKKLLAATDLPVGEVAFASGYYNVAYFSRVFRIRNGETPAQYRGRHRDK